jgi:hypothetical protein
MGTQDVVQRFIDGVVRVLLRLQILRGRYVYVITSFDQIDASKWSDFVRNHEGIFQTPEFYLFISKYHLPHCYRRGGR